VPHFAGAIVTVALLVIGFSCVRAPVNDDALAVVNTIITPDINAAKDFICDTEFPIFVSTDSRMIPLTPKNGEVQLFLEIM
jgi:hypothetical protein